MSFTFEDERQYNMAEDRRLAAKEELAERRELRMKAADLAWWDCPKLHREIYAKSEQLGWKVSRPFEVNQNIDGDVFRLALGSLPNGWERHHASDSIFMLYSKAHDQCVITATAVGGHIAIYSPPWYWPEAVRSGQYEIAGRLLAAHLELELRKGGAK